MSERAHPEDPGFKDRWFGLVKNPYKKHLFERYKFCVPYVKNKIVLDVPCGTGWGTVMLSSAKKVYGLDISMEAVEYANKHFKKKNIIYYVGTMIDLGFDDCFFDIITCLEGYEHINKKNQILFLKEAIRVLNKDGLLIMTCPVTVNGVNSGNPYHLHEPSEEELVEILSKHFSIEILNKIKGPDSPIYYFVGRKKC